MAVLSLAVPLVAVGQAGPPPLAALDNVTGCTVEGAEVFVTTGQAGDQRRYKYAWDAAIDAFCNARGFAIATPNRATPATRTATPAPAPVPSVAARAEPAPTQPPASPAPASPPAAQVGGAAFPEGARELTADELSARLEGKVFTVRSAAGVAVGRLQLNRGGVAYYNSGGGFNASGNWRLEGSTICYRWNGGSPPSGCNEIRLVGVQLHARSMAGPIIRLDE